MILDGKKVRKIRAERLKKAVSGLKARLAIVQIGARAESNAYIAQKIRFADEIGASVSHVQFPEKVEEAELADVISGLNADPAIHGIIVQMPIPARLDKHRIINAIAPRKDVDGLTDVNVAKLRSGESGHVPATARGIGELLDFYGIDVQAKKVAVLGRSALVGAPTAQMLLNKGALVSVCHSQTPNTKAITKDSDIVIVAIGKPRFVGPEYVKKGQVVVDVGITAVTESGQSKLEEEIPVKKLVGDVDFDSIKDLVFAVSPVPGGVGPMTVLALFENLLDACNR